MDSDTIYLSTVYDKDGRRIGLSTDTDLENASLRGRSGALFFGDGSTFKVWTCAETKPVFKWKGQEKGEDM